MNKEHPAIITNKRNEFNSAIKRITMDEYYDIMHHTHNISDLIVADGVTYSDLIEKMNTVIKTLNTHKKIIEVQQKEIAKLKSEIKESNDVNNIETISEMNNSKQQTENGLGSLMGFTMTEI